MHYKNKPTVAYWPIRANHFLYEFTTTSLK
ncbi:MAG: hypothetical protein ACI810_002362 [Gammaproteobacteria bacterium]